MSGSGRIQLKLVSTDGGEHTAMHTAANLFNPNASDFYSSARANNVCVVAQTAKLGHMFVAEEIAVVNPPGHYDAPVRTAIAFISNSVPSPSDFAGVDDTFSRDQFQELVHGKQVFGHDARPVAFFELAAADERCGQQLRMPVRGQYLTVKFLASHGGNIDCRAIELLGREVHALRQVHASRPVQPPVPHSNMRSVGLRMFAAMLEAVDASDEDACRLVLSRVSRHLQRTEPGELFGDWAPAPLDDEEEAALDASHVLVSSEDPGALGSNVLAADDATSFWSPAEGAGDEAAWGTRLQRPTCVQRVLIKFKDGACPASVLVSLAHVVDAPGQGVPPEALLQPAAAARVRQADHVSVTLPAASRQRAASAIQIAFSGTHPNNKDKRIAVSAVRVTTPAPQHSLAPRECLAALERWAARLLRTSPNEEIRAEAMRVMMRLATASASLGSQLRLADALLSSPSGAASGLSPLPQPAGVAEAAGSFLARLEREARERELELLETELQFKAGRGRVVLDEACFDEEASSSGVEVQDGGVRVRSKSGNNQHCLLSVGFSATVCSWAAWEFKLDEDTNSQTTCFGAALKPVTNSSYERSKELMMYRAYNGQIYSRGTTSGARKRKIAKGSTVRFEVTFSDGKVRASVDGEDQGVVFEVEAADTVYPAVAFYGAGRIASIVRVESDRDGSSTPLRDCPLLASRVGFGSLGWDGKLGYGPRPGVADPGVSVAGQTARSSLSMHPPEGDRSRAELAPADDSVSPEVGCAYAEFGLGGEFAMFRARCAINSSADAGMLAGSGVRAYFEVWVDGRLAWRSPAHREPEAESQVQLMVTHRQRLRLVTRCVGCNWSAHCVWLSPSLVPATEYSLWFEAMLSGSPGAVETLPPPPPAATASADAFCARMLAVAGALASTHTRVTRDAPTRFTADGDDETSAPHPLEAAHALEVSPGVLAMQVQLMERLLARATAGEDAGAREVADAALCAVLELAGANVRRLAVSCVDPDELGFGPAPAPAEESKDASGAAEARPVTLDEGADAFARERMAGVLAAIVGGSAAAAAAGGPATRASARARALAGEVLHVGSSLLVPGAEERSAALRAAAEQCRVIEVQLRWPVVAAGVSEDPRLERAALAVQAAAVRQGWQTVVLGKWMALLYLAIEVPDYARCNGSAATFLEEGLRKCMAEADVEGYCSATGLAEPHLSLRVEHDHTIDRAARLLREPGVGCVRLFVGEDTSLDAVCDGIRAFDKLQDA